MRDEPLLDIRGLRKSFGATIALDHVDLQVRTGEIITLLGPSGSGKTTLLRLIAGFETPSAGQLALRGRDVTSVTPAERGVGMVFQHYALFPHMTVADNIAYGLRLRRWSAGRRRARVAEVLAQLRLSGYEERYPHQLSGGQQQRIALGRALAYDPDLILMDEPLGALDRALRIEMEAEIRRIHRDLRATIVYVTHNQQEALALSDRIAVMHEGRVVGLGPPEELYYRPPNRFIAGFFSNANLLPVDRYEVAGARTARVRHADAELSCYMADESADAPALAVRPRSLRRREQAGGLRLQGVVTETLLLGDERQVTFDVPSAGTVVAVIDARDSSDIHVGESVTFHAPASELVLVGEA